MERANILILYLSSFTNLFLKLVKNNLSWLFYFYFNKIIPLFYLTIIFICIFLFIFLIRAWSFIILLFLFWIKIAFSSVLFNWSILLRSIYWETSIFFCKSLSRINLININMYLCCWIRIILLTLLFLIVKVFWMHLEKLK